MADLDSIARPSVAIVRGILTAAVASFSLRELTGAASKSLQEDAAVGLPHHSRQSLAPLHSDSEHFTKVQ